MGRESSGRNGIILDKYVIKNRKCITVEQRKNKFIWGGNGVIGNVSLRKRKTINNKPHKIWKDKSLFEQLATANWADFSKKKSSFR